MAALTPITIPTYVNTQPPAWNNLKLFHALVANPNVSLPLAQMTFWWPNACMKSPASCCRQQ